ncbi:hypothetical protein TSH7_14035 [Azospirillum sp. TSH7]|nr:hypothetical protein TSH7_14035 [Azospirillum sp. TSH7]PWC72708.1 hypothetical protein TSH20_00530 [Azospirillum sp. TSH20]
MTVSTSHLSAYQFTMSVEDQLWQQHGHQSSDSFYKSIPFIHPNSPRHRIGMAADRLRCPGLGQREGF